MNGHRQAAVALYGLAQSDQERILAELPANDQRILQDYLAELAALGFDKAANMAEAMAPAVAPAAPAASSTDPNARLRAASAAQLHAALAHEPAALIAQVMALDSWPWAADLLDLLPPQRRKLVRDALEAQSAAPARARFLLTAVSAALRDTPSLAATQPGPRRATIGFTKWLPWTR